MVKRMGPIRLIHRIFSDHGSSVQPCHFLRVAAPEYLERLVMLMEFEDDEDRSGAGGELFGRSDGNNFMGSLKSELLIKPFGEHDVAEHSFGWGVEVIGFRALGAVLEIGNRHIAGDLRPREGSRRAGRWDSRTRATASSRLGTLRPAGLSRRGSAPGLWPDGPLGKREV